MIGVSVKRGSCASRHCCGDLSRITSLLRRGKCMRQEVHGDDIQDFQIIIMSSIVHNLFFMKIT